MLIKSLCEQSEIDDKPVLVQGFGEITIGQAKTGAINRIKSTLEKLSQDIDNPNAWKAARFALYDSGVTKSFMDTIISEIDVEKGESDANSK